MFLKSKYNKNINDMVKTAFMKCIMQWVEVLLAFKGMSKKHILKVDKTLMKSKCFLEKLMFMMLKVVQKEDNPYDPFN